MKIFKKFVLPFTFISLIVALLIYSASITRPYAPAIIKTKTMTIAGTVVANNQVSAKANASQALRIRDAKGKIVRVVFPVGEGQYVVRETVPKLRKGDKIEVTGELSKQNEIVCNKPGHELKVNTYRPGL